jgi:hypothetical protein
MMKVKTATKAVLAVFGMWIIVIAAYALGVAWFLNRVLNLVEKALGQ